jgi:hypothetical protein
MHTQGNNTTFTWGQTTTGLQSKNNNGSEQQHANKGKNMANKKGPQPDN